MTTLTIEIESAQLDALRRHAAQAGITPEAFIVRLIAQATDTPQLTFDAAAALILERYAELYRRLA